MPAMRRSGRLSNGPSTKQSTINFNHRVTKNVSRSVKDTASTQALLNKTVQSDKPTEIVKRSKPAAQHITEIETDIASDTPQIEQEAQKLSDASIERFWQQLEAERLAKRVHQEGLSTGEKVLRHFDVSSQYGPCIGISRVKRWHRAQKLGLKPPLEVLAVLGKEQARTGNCANERAHLDDLLNSSATSAA